MTNVSDLRRTALRARRNLSAGYRQQASQRACRHLARLPGARHARRVGIYWPLASEIDPRPLITLLPRSTQFYLPRVAGNSLRFVRWRPSIRWTRSPLGMLEPVGQRGHDVAALDLLIMPLAGFDHYGHRIGLGGGFYDRTLSATRYAPYRGPRRIGLAFACQALPTIPPQPWDVALDAVASEYGVHRRGIALLG